MQHACQAVQAWIKPAFRLESHPCDVGAVPSAPSPAILVAAFKSLGRGSVEMKPCKSLRFSKAYAPGGQEARVVRRRVHPVAQRNFPESTDGE